MFIPKENSWRCRFGLMVLRKCLHVLERNHGPPRLTYPLAKAWAAGHRMRAIWQSDMRGDLKINLFQATVESILLYGSETWTITASLKKKIDGCYTRMLWMVLDSKWKDRKRNRVTNADTYGSLQRVSTKIQQRRMWLAGHIHRHNELVGHEPLLWERKHGHSRSPEREKTNLCRHTQESHRAWLCRWNRLAYEQQMLVADCALLTLGPCSRHKSKLSFGVW